MAMETKPERNQRESDNLMNIVAVVYGVAITIALSVRPDAILHPASAEELIPSVALLSAVLLAAFSFYSYVLAIGGDKPYDVAWTSDSNSSKWFGIIRFVVDLVLAGLYVHLLLAAVSIETGANTKPRLAGFVFAFVLVFAGAVVVRAVRRRQISWVASIATVVSLVLCFWVRSRIATRRTDLAVEVVLLVGVLLYGWLYQQFAYRDWRTRVGEPALKLVIYRPASTADKAKFDSLLVEKLSELRRPRADSSLVHAWSLDPDRERRKGAVLILNFRGRPGTDSPGALRFADEESIATEIIELRKLELRTNTCKVPRTDLSRCGLLRPTWSRGRGLSEA